MKRVVVELLKIAREITSLDHDYKISKWYYFRPPRGSLRQKQVRWKVGIDLDWSKAAKGRDETDYADEEREMLLKIFKSDMQKVKAAAKAKIGRPSITIPDEYVLSLKAEIYVPVFRGEEEAQKVLESLGYRV